jgi:CENP-B N-terminal DNA-binding domain
VTDSKEEPQLVITEEEVVLDAAGMRILASVMRSMHHELGMSKAAIGRRFGMPRETVRDIVNGKSWRRKREHEATDSFSDNG